jgi:hypothetical protein
MKRFAPLCALALLACSSVACSSGGADDTSAQAGLPAVATSSKGTFVLAATTLDGAAPERGLTVLDLRVARAADGAPAPHLQITVKPWMPAMGHGAPPAHVVEESAGRYRVESLSLYMPGLWQLRTTLSPGDEEAVLELDVR